MSSRIRQRDDASDAARVAWKQVPLSDADQGRGPASRPPDPAEATAHLEQQSEQRVREAHASGIREGEAAGRKRAAAEVEPVLERLARRGNLLGLVTGNLQRIGWRKLERAGLREYFRFGAFGEMAKNRAGLAKLAIREARRNGWIAREAAVSLIGDAPQDIQAARANRIRAISVKTGITPVAELEALQPDVLLRDLRDFRLRMVE